MVDLGETRIKERMFIYADNAVMFLCPDEQELTMVSTILDIFAGASGLHTNKRKCLILPIQCGLEETDTLLRFFPGCLEQLFAHLLRHPLSIYKLSKAQLQTLVDKVANALPTWKATVLNRAGRTVLTKVKLFAVPIHTTIAVALSPWAIRCIDKRRRAFLWRGTKVVSGSHCLLAWLKCCRPTHLGGLGLPNLQVAGFALRMLWLWFCRVDSSRP